MAVLVSGGAAHLYLSGGASYRPDELQIAQGNVLEDCLRAAQLMFDVKWAAACTTKDDGDDGAECDLPPAKAAVVNAWLNEEEKGCMAEARAAR
jgi:hypothetical protein